MTTPLGEEIRKIRIKKDLSLRELARNIDKSAAFLSDIERGNRYPSEEALKDIADYLEVDFEELKKYDTRPPVKDLKKRAKEDPEYGKVLRRIVDQDLSSEDLKELLDEKEKKS